MKKCKCGKRSLGGLPQFCSECGLQLPYLRKRDLPSVRKSIQKALNKTAPKSKRAKAFRDFVEEVGFEVLKRAVNDAKLEHAKS